MLQVLIRSASLRNFLRVPTTYVFMEKQEKVCFFFLKYFLSVIENICCGYSLEAPWQGTSIEYPQHVFMEK